MKAFLRFCTKVLTKCNQNWRTAIIVIVTSIYSNVSTAQMVTWVGSGTLSGTNTLLGQNFDNPLNWSPARVPTAADSVLIPFTMQGTVNMVTNATIKTLVISVRYFNLNNNNNNNNTATFNVGAATLVITGPSFIDVQDEHPNNKIYIGVNDAISAGTIDFRGDVTLGSTNLRDGVYLFGNPNTTIICRANLTLGIKSQVEKGSEPGTLLFDGTGTQTFTYNNTSNLQNSCRFNNVVIGKNNNPTVILAGTTSPDNIIGNLTINGSSVLDINTRQFNRQSNGGNFSLKNTSILRLGGLTSALNNGSASLIPGSNFPSGFTNILLDSTSTVEFYGTNQSIPGATHSIKGYGNLTLVNNIKTLISSFAMFRNLSIAANTTIALGNFDDTLKSNNVTTAYVSALPTTAVISYGSGAFVVERHLQAYKSWRLLATPIDTASTMTISGAWREGNAALTSTGNGTQITGPQGPTPANAGAVLDVFTQRGSVKSWNPAINNYVEVTNANATRIANLAGYYVFVRGDRGVGLTGTTSATNLRIKGRIRRDNQVFSVPVNKFVSVGNPFASRIDFRTVTKSTVVEAFYVWNPNPAGTFYNAGKYEVYILNADGNYRLGGSVGGGVRNYIESGQAVFIQSVTGGSITVKESDKFGGSSLVSRGAVSTGRQGINNPTFEINLRTTDGNGEDVLADAAVLNFDATFNNDIDNLDVKKILNSSDNLSIKKGNVNLVVDRRASLTATDTIFLNLSNTRISNYRFNINPSMLLCPTLQAFMVDKFLNTETALSFTAPTDHAFAVTVDAASRVTNRFIIIFKSVSPAVFTAIKAVRNNDNGVAVTWNMNNENNINTYSIERSNDGGTNYTVINSQMPTANNFGNPYYTFIDAAAPKGLVWYRIIANTISNSTFTSDEAAAKAVDVNTKHGISMYPNPVVDGRVNLYFNNKPSGKYNISIVNSKGEQIKLSVVDVNNNAAVKTIAINEAAAGIYEVVVDDNKRMKLVIPFVKL